MKKSSSKLRRSQFQLEDKGQWSELQRSHEIKQYSGAVRQLFRRSVIMRFVSLLSAFYIAIVYIYVWGVPHLMQSSTSAEGRKVFMLSVTACLVLLAVFIVPMSLMIFRPRLFRVSRKGITQPATVYDNEDG